MTLLGLSLRGFGGRQYGPWSDPRLPWELREPYSAWSWGPSSDYGRPIKRPFAIIFWGSVLALTAVFPMVLVFAFGRTEAAFFVIGFMVLAGLGVPAFYLLNVGFRRWAWVRRVKRVTGMSPFKMDSKNIPPPGCEAPPGSPG